MKNYRPTKRQIILTIAFIVVALGLVFSLTRQKTIVVSVQDVNVRSGPGLKYKSLEKVDKKTRFNVLDEKDNWYKVRINDHKFGWVASWLVNREDNLKKASNLSEATIVIDAGHGGSDSGAEYKDSTKTKYMEKTYTLQMAKAVATQLRAQGAHVIMIRDTDEYVSLKKIAATSNKVSADAFISFHFDSSPERNTASGLTTYYYHNGASKQLAKALNAQFDGLALTNRGVQFGNFYVIRYNSRPAVLCEMGYINETKDFKKIKSKTYQVKVASKVVKGLQTYFNN